MIIYKVPGNVSCKFKSYRGEHLCCTKKLQNKKSTRFSNKSKQDADLVVAKRLMKLADIISQAELAKETPSLKHVLASFGGSKHDFKYKIEGNYIKYCFESEGRTDIQTSEVFTDALSGEKTAFISVPLSYLYHDEIINPRGINSTISLLIKEFHKPNPQLHLSLARLDSGRIKIFDGQHKAVAQIMLGIKEIVVRLFINPDVDRLIETNTIAGSKLKQIAFDKAIVRQLHDTMYSERLKQYQIDHHLAEDDFSFSEQNLVGHFRGERGNVKLYIIALMPGEQITSDTPATLDAAKITLDYRGDESTGWALAHRLCSRARTGEGDHAYILLQNLLKTRTHPNLWDVHPPFQIDGNFGATAGITEMLLQSHGGYISILPAIPEKWQNISFKGLKARGNFEVSLDYKNGIIENCGIISFKGEQITLYYGGETDGISVCNNGCEIPVKHSDGKVIFNTTAGEKYCLSGFKKRVNRLIARDFVAKWQKNGVKLEWKNDGNEYYIFRAENSEAKYTFIGKSKKGEFADGDFSESNKTRLTYKLVLSGSDKRGRGNGALAFLNPASELEKERYAYRFKVNNLNIEK